MRAVQVTVALGVGFLISLSAVQVAAHHAFAAEFDAARPVTLRGTVAQLEWTNPHIWIHMDVKSADGAPVRWRVEGGPPNALYRQGWKKGTITIGQELTVNGYLAKNGSPTTNATTIKLPDGTVFGAASSAPEKPVGEPNRY